MPMRDYKTMIRIDPRLRAGLKRAAAAHNLPIYLLGEKIMWDWLAVNHPDIARQCYDWTAPKADQFKIKPPTGAVQFLETTQEPLPVSHVD
jgi:hypothetical protein